MFKNFNWKTFFLTVITALLAGIGVDKSGVLDTEQQATTEQIKAFALAAAPLADADAQALANDNAGCNPYCAIYKVTAFWRQPLTIVGNGTPEYKFTVLTPFTQSVLITGAYTNAGAIIELEKAPSYPGWKVDKIASKEFVQWVKRPNSGGGQTPVPDPPTK